MFFPLPEDLLGSRALDLTRAAQGGRVTGDKASMAASTGKSGCESAS